MIAIRRALPEQAERLREIARAAKATWGYPTRWLDLWREALTVTPQFIEANPVFVAIMNDSVVAFVARVPAFQQRWLREHLWVDPPQMKQGIGQQLVQFVSNVAASNGVQELAIDAEPFADPFYLRLGAVRVGEAVGTIDGHARVRPELLLSTDLLHA